MKHSIKVLLVAAMACLTMSFTTKKENKKVVNTNESTIVWKGYKVAGSHEGTIKIKSGFLNFDNEILTGGEFVIDMTTINTTDLEGDWKAKLDGHLKSEDFFSVETHKTSKLVFTKVIETSKNIYTVSADLTIKEKTNPVKFQIEVNNNVAIASLKIDRTKFDVKYGSSSFFDNLKDKAIDNEFDLIATLKF